MTKIVSDFLYEDQTYLLNGIFFDTHNELGRFAREKQYADNLEQRFKLKNIPYKREVVVGDSGNSVDFIVWDLILLELKAKPFLQTEDFEQTQRYLHQTNLKLGILINFRSKYLKPQRILKISHRQVSANLHLSVDQNNN